MTPATILFFTGYLVVGGLISRVVYDTLHGDYLTRAIPAFVVMLMWGPMLVGSFAALFVLWLATGELPDFPEV